MGPMSNVPRRVVTEHDERGHLGEPVNFRERVDDHLPDPRLYRLLQFGVGLVVAMQADVIRPHPSLEQDGQLAA